MASRRPAVKTRVSYAGGMSRWLPFVVALASLGCRRDAKVMADAAALPSAAPEASAAPSAAPSVAPIADAGGATAITTCPADVYVTITSAGILVRVPAIAVADVVYEACAFGGGCGIRADGDHRASYWAGTDMAEIHGSIQQRGNTLVVKEKMTWQGRPEPASSTKPGFDPFEGKGANPSRPLQSSESVKRTYQLPCADAVNMHVTRECHGEACRH
jgi:hypothetical protein